MNATSMKVRVLLLGLSVVFAAALQGCVVDPDESDEDEIELGEQVDNHGRDNLSVGNDDGTGEDGDDDTGEDGEDGALADDAKARDRYDLTDRYEIARPTAWIYSLPLPPGQKTRARRSQTSRVGEDPPPEPW